jgi:hypothetical protein
MPPVMKSLYDHRCESVARYSRMKACCGGPATWPRSDEGRPAAALVQLLLCQKEKIWSGRRGSNPRPRPWQGRALPLSYTRIRDGGDRSPATAELCQMRPVNATASRTVRARLNSSIFLTNRRESARINACSPDDPGYERLRRGIWGLRPPWYRGAIRTISRKISAAFRSIRRVWEAQSKIAHRCARACDVEGTTPARSPTEPVIEICRQSAI